VTAVTYTLGELARRLDLECRGDAAVELKGLAALPSAQSDQLSFLADKRYRDDLPGSAAGAVILTVEMAEQFAGNCLISANPYLSYAQASQLFDDAIGWGEGIAESAFVDPSAVIGDNVSIGPNASIAAGVVIGAGSRIAAGCSIGAAAVIGENCLLHANVTVYHKVRIGDRVKVHSGTVIGSDGFGYAPSREGWTKIAQLGTVVIGNDVEIGACTAIDRGAIEDTVIADGVIIDNQVHIAHNCRIGEGTAIAGCVGMAGSTVIGKNCTMAGMVGIAGHLEICDNVHLSGMTVVTKSITDPGSYSSGTGMMPSRDWRKSAVRFSQLDDIYKRLQALEKRSQ
jgi:UDP-3-O-[3-hydroxymyristoyl] glucosamine N-acyltransferase